MALSENEKKGLTIAGIISAICFILASLGIGDPEPEYPKMYYYVVNGEKVVYIINQDGTAKIKTSMGGTDFNFDTSWHSPDGTIWVKTQMGYSNVIKEGYVYETSDDADAKRNGIKLTLQK